MAGVMVGRGESLSVTDLEIVWSEEELGYHCGVVKMVDKGSG